MKLKRKSSTHQQPWLLEVLHSYMVYCTKLNPTEVPEQKYDWGGLAGVRGCEAADYPRKGQELVGLKSP